MKSLWVIRPDTPTPTCIIPPLFMVQDIIIMDIVIPIIIAIPTIQPGDIMLDTTIGTGGGVASVIAAGLFDLPLDTDDGTGEAGGVPADTADTGVVIVMATERGHQRVTEPDTGKASVTLHKEISINLREIRQG